MKKLHFILSFILVLTSSKLLAQSWVNGGNTLTTSGQFGTNSNSSVIFETNNTERGRLSKEGFWGFGTSTPNARVTVNSPAGLSPFRVQLNGSTKFLVNGEGGVAIGASVYAPVDGLYVKGKVGIGIVNPNYDTQLEVVNNSPGTFRIGIRSQGSFAGVYGNSSRNGVYGYSDDGNGIRGYSEYGNGGYFTSYEDIALYASTNYGSYAAYFEGDTYSTGTYQGSDQNLKKNIREVGNALSIINQLKPKYYEFKNEAQYTSLHLPKGHHYGLLAQDVEAVLPNLVKESSHQLHDPQEAALKPTANGKPAAKVDQKAPQESMKIKAVNYTELIPLLIKAVQEQQQTITTLTDKIAQLEAGSRTGGNTTGNNANLGGVSLAQNQPNPFNQATTFRYTVPAGANAQIMIYDGLSGALLKTVPAPATGQAELSGHDLKAGTYIYSLVVNGKQVDSKKMVLSK